MQGIEGSVLGHGYFGREYYEEFDVGKEIKSVFGSLGYSHSCSSHINDPPSQHQFFLSPVFRIYLLT